MRREMSQLQRFVERGSADMGTVKLCVEAPQEQDTVSILVLEVDIVGRRF